MPPPCLLPRLPSLSQPPQLGLDIGPHHLRLAAVQARGRRRRELQVMALAEQRFEAAICHHGQLGDLDLITRACTDLLRTHGLLRGVLHMALPAQAVPQWPLTLPASSPVHARMAQARADCLLRLGSGAAHALLDYRPLHPCAATDVASEQALLLACCPALLVEDRQALARALGVRCGTIGLQEQLSTALLRGGPAAGDATVLHLARDTTWLMHGQSLQLLAWQPAHTIPALLLELAPCLLPAPSQLLLTGELAHLPGLVPALARYAGLGSGIGRLPAVLHAPPVNNLPAFHAALALATAQHT